MKGLPLWNGRFPIPFTAFNRDGVVDLKTIDVEKQIECLKGGLCAVCGQAMNNGVWFIGGPKAAWFRHFKDSAMHEECARYSIMTCPHLAISKGKYAPKPGALPEGFSTIVDTTMDEKVSTFMLGVSSGYQVHPIDDGTFIIQSQPWLHLEWWRDRCQVLPPPEFMTLLSGVLNDKNNKTTVGER